MKKHTRKFLEKILFKSRYIILLAIISLIVSSVFIFLWTLINFTQYLIFNVYDTKQVIIKLITSIDLYLLWIVTLIVWFSLYEIYLKSDNSKLRIPKAFIVNSLNDLKDKLTSVILIILIITYFQYSIELKYNNSYELLAFALWIFFISLSIYFSKKKYILTKKVLNNNELQNKKIK